MSLYFMCFHVWYMVWLLGVSPSTHFTNGKVLHRDSLLTETCPLSFLCILYKDVQSQPHWDKTAKCIQGDKDQICSARLSHLSYSIICRSSPMQLSQRRSTNICHKLYIFSPGSNLLLFAVTIIYSSKSGSHW